jgi:hypothetical protein
MRHDRPIVTPWAMWVGESGIDSPSDLARL